MLTSVNIWTSITGQISFTTVSDSWSFAPYIIFWIYSFFTDLKRECCLFATATCWSECDRFGCVWDVSWGIWGDNDSEKGNWNIWVKTRRGVFNLTSVFVLSEDMKLIGRWWAKVDKPTNAINVFGRYGSSPHLFTITKTATLLDFLGASRF